MRLSPRRSCSRWPRRCGNSRSEGGTRSSCQKEPQMRIGPGRVAAVTGGAGGIGYALATAAANRGLGVVLSDVRADALDAAADRLRESGAVVTPVVADVSQPADIDRLARTAFALGSVQLVCSNAGIVVLGRAWELTAADWDRVMNINFMATVHLARAFVPRL